MRPRNAVQPFTWCSALLAALATVAIGCEDGPPDGPGAPTDATAAAATATQLAFTVQPAGTSANATIAPAVEVTAQDAQGNTVTSFTGNVTVALAANPSGGTLAGSKTKAAVAGVATFDNLSIKKSGAGYTLRATSGTRTPATSNAFDITAGAVSVLVFTTQPSRTAAGATIAPAVEVTARDSFANTVTSFVGSVTMTISSNPGGGILSGTTPVHAVAGVATFPDLSIDKAANGYRLTAAADTFAISAAFPIVSAGVTRLGFTVQPSTAKAGATIAPAVRVTALDAFGNKDTSFTGDVALSIGTNPGGGTLLGTTTKAAVAGVATFSGTPGLSIDKVGTGYTLVANSGSLAAATSAAFNITPGTAAVLVFTGQPGTTPPGAFITPGVEVTVQDSFANTATGFAGNVTIAIGANPGGGVLSGAKTRAAVAGVATFANLSISAGGAGYTLQATSGTKPPVTSNAFDEQGCDCWSSVPDMRTPRIDVTGASAGGLVYAIGGYLSDYTGATEAYDPGSNSWTVKADMPTPRLGAGLAVFNGRIYAAGGEVSGAAVTDVLEVFDPGSNTWTAKAPMPQPRARVTFDEINGTLYAAGGNGPTANSGALEAYDPTANTWTAKASMPTPRTGAGSGVINGILYVVGGTPDGQSSFATLESYNPATDSWTRRAAMPTPRYGPAVRAINGLLYVAGGSTFAGSFTPAVEVYNPATNSWSARSPIPTPRRWMGAAVLSGSLFAIGGERSDPGTVATVEVYKP